MRVDWIIPCRYVEVNDGLATIVGGGIDVYAVPSLPTPVYSTLAVRLVGLPDEHEHPLEITILGADMQEAGAPLHTTITPAAGPGAIPGWEIAMIVPIMLEFQAPGEGPYTFNVAIDGASKSVTVRVVQMESR